MSDHNEAGVATQVRAGGTYQIDPETGERRRVDAPAPAEEPAGNPSKKKVK